MTLTSRRSRRAGRARDKGEGGGGFYGDQNPPSDLPHRSKWNKKARAAKRGLFGSAALCGQLLELEVDTVSDGAHVRHISLDELSQSFLAELVAVLLQGNFVSLEQPL